MPTIESILPLYTNQRTYNNAKSKLKRVNQLLQLTPVNEIHTQAYVDNFPRMCHLLLTTKGTSGGVIKSKDELTAFIGAIIGAVTRTLNGEHNPLSTQYAKLRIADIPNPKPEFNADPWEITLQKLYDAATNCPNDFGRLVSCIYSHGYVLRVGEIFTTTIKPIPEYNHLDLDTGVWTISNHKNKARGDRTFKVNEECLIKIRTFVNPKCPFLIHKSTLRPYTVQTLAVIELTDLPANSQLRNSYEQWNWNASGRTRDQKLHWSINVLGHSEATVQGYYTRNDVQDSLRAFNFNSDSYETSSE
jgi:hypothetical protein